MFILVLYWRQNKNGRQGSQTTNNICRGMCSIRKNWHKTYWRKETLWWSCLICSVWMSNYRFKQYNWITFSIFVFVVVAKLGFYSQIWTISRDLKHSKLNCCNPCKSFTGHKQFQLHFSSTIWFENMWTYILDTKNAMIFSLVFFFLL